MTIKPASFQDVAHPDSWNYEVGSPHLSHARLNGWMTETITAVVADLLARLGSVRVLEVGAGHGSFTDRLLALGADVTVTEMSQASARRLRDRYEHNAHAEVLFDATGDGLELEAREFDLILCVAVLHHIPDYLAAIRGWAGKIAPGGAFVCFQDPLWYPRQSSGVRVFERASYYLWRLFRGEYSAGLRSVLRRARDAYDIENPRDMVEYHVLRDGCDEQAIMGLLQASFDAVQIHRYWSTQIGGVQWLGERMGIASEFGVIANGRSPSWR